MTNYASAGYGGGNKKKPAKKHAKKSGHHGISGFLGNLVDDVQETATSLVPGLVDSGKAVVHDVGVMSGLAHGSYKTDDILNAIRHSYTDKGTFWGELGRAFIDPTDAGHHLKASGHAFYENPLGPALDVGALFTGGGTAYAKGAGLLGKGAEEASLVRRIGTAERGFDRTLSKNPVIRARQNLFENMAGKLSDDAPVLGTERRVARHIKKVESRKAAHENAKTLRPFRQALAKLTRNERNAVWVAAGGHKLDDLDAMYAAREDAIKAEIRRKKDRGHKSEPGDTFEVEAPRELSAATGHMASHTDAPGTSLVLREDGKIRRAGTDEELRYEESGVKGLADADRRDSLKVNHRNLSKIQKRRAELAKVRKSGVLDKPSERLAAAVNAARELSATTTRRLQAEGLADDAALGRMRLESELMREAGVPVDAYEGAIRSHVRLAPDKLDVSSGKRPKFTKPGALDELKKSTGYAFWNALDDTNPAMYLHSARQVFEHRARLDRFEALVRTADWVSPDEAAGLVRSGHWKIVEASSPLRKDIDEVYKTLVDAAEAFDGVPGYDEMIRNMREGLVRDGATDMVPVVPAAYYKELVGEFARANDFVRKFIDAPTRVWRALTLNLRPAWIVNNFVGQMFLLGVAHGAKGLKAYFEQFGKKGKLVGELAPELTDFGWAHESVADLAGMGTRSKIAHGMRRTSEFFGKLNEKLTDDHTRAAAWIAEMKPHVARYRKAHPGTSWEDAARTLWNDERFADAVTEKVLADMIDFSDLSDFERRYVKRAIPFYAWIKGISKRTGRLVADEPGKAVIGANAAKVGQANLEERYGALPSFLQGMIGVGDKGALTSQGLNPFVTPSDVVQMLSGVVLPGRQDGAQNPLAQLNPLFKAPAEALANRDFFYGNEIDRDGTMSFGSRVAHQGVNSIAQYRLLKEWQQAQDAKDGGLEYDPLFEPSMRNAILQYLGIPYRQLDIAAANAKAAKG